MDNTDQMIVVFRERFQDIKVAGVEKENGVWKTPEPIKNINRGRIRLVT